MPSSNFIPEGTGFPFNWWMVKSDASKRYEPIAQASDVWVSYSFPIEIDPRYSSLFYNTEPVWPLEMPGSMRPAVAPISLPLAPNPSLSPSNWCSRALKRAGCR